MASYPVTILDYSYYTIVEADKPITLLYYTDTDPAIPSGGTTRPTYGQEWPRGNW